MFHLIGKDSSLGDAGAAGDFGELGVEQGPQVIDDGLLCSWRTACRCSGAWLRIIASP
jgi:hypothetical protein